VQAFISRSGKRALARVVAVVDVRYRELWGEKAGHLVWFEARHEAGNAVQALLEEAAGWLRARDCSFVRAGFGPWEPGFLIDNYEIFHPQVMRHTAPWYHAMFKQAGFETEKGGAEYTMPVTRASAETLERQRHAALAQGYKIVTLSSLSAKQRVSDAYSTWNATFSRHWGLAPMTMLEFGAFLSEAAETGVLNFSAMLYTAAEEPAGVTLAGQTAGKALPVRFSRNTVANLNTFAVGVLERHRRRALATSLAAHTFLALIARGAKSLSYGIVLDDNLSSRKSALKLGCGVNGNYVTYRAELS